jgi:UDP-N-acetylglucosamine pyrophosphorylase
MLLYCRSLIEVRSGKSFIDIIVEHIEVLNFRYGTNILLILATSDNTDEPLSQAVRKYSNSHLKIVTFNQVIILGGFKSEICIHFLSILCNPSSTSFL